jgi:hypothetical protein
MYLLVEGQNPVMFGLGQSLRVGLVAVFWVVAMVAGGRAQIAPQFVSPNGQLVEVLTAQRARLIHNPKLTAGLPKYALTDRSGTIQRYIEPLDGIDLEPHIDQVVIVQHDTGRTLLASQLQLPDTPAVPTGIQKVTSSLDTAATQSDTFFKRLSYEEEVELIPAVTGNQPDWVAEELPADVEPVYIDEPTADSYGCSHCCGSCDGGCDGCSYRYRDQGFLAGVFDYGCRPRGCAPGARGRYYLRGEYLLWRFDGMENAAAKSQLLHKHRSGGRATFGYFLDPCGLWAVEGDYLTFGSTSENVPDSKLVNSQFVSSGLRLVHNLSCIDAGRRSCCRGYGGSACHSCGSRSFRHRGYGTRRVDMTFGLRYADLQEQLHDNTDNDFIGPELGYNWEWIYRRWKVDLLSKLAIGNIRHDRNTGHDNDLSVLPELGFRFSYKLAENLDFNMGYTFVYWSNVIRPDNEANKSYRETDFWAQGLTTGLEYRR